ncbi:MAG: hypothetical protein HOY78_31120 [Saccharothrix sp.]|nr:hypothetical protein [Saccharothrix sp.]
MTASRKPDRAGGRPRRGRIVDLALLSPGEVAAWPLVAEEVAALIAFAAVAWARRN